MTTREHYTDRLRSNVEKAAAEFERIAARHAELVAQGRDTSLPTPAKSADQSLAQAEARWERATKELADYEAETARRERENA